MKVLLNLKYRYLEPYIKWLPEIFEERGVTVYQSRNLIKTFTTPDDLQINVKRYHKPRYLNLFLYSLGLRKPKGKRAFNHPAILLKRGVDTPEPVAYIEERSWGLLGYSYFISIQCPYPHLMYELGDAGPELYEPMASAFARFTANMHDKGILHLDYSPGNILWEQTPEGGFRFSIIDINRMSFGQVGMKKGCENFKRIWGPKRFMQLVAEHYARERGFDVSRTVELVMKYRTKFWTRYIKKHDKPFPIEL